MLLSMREYQRLEFTNVLEGSVVLSKATGSLCRISPIQEAGRVDYALYVFIVRVYRRSFHPAEKYAKPISAYFLG